MNMCWHQLFSLIILMVCLTETDTLKRCKYDKRGYEWSPCDHVLHVKTKTVSLTKGREECPKRKTITKPCNGGIIIDGCVYVPVSRWSGCDPLTLTDTRTLELQSGSSDDCDRNKVESRDCGKTNNRSRLSGKKKKMKRRWRKGKLWIKDDKGCMYKAGSWGNCDPVENTRVRSLKLKRGPYFCKKKKIDSRLCTGRKRKKGGDKKERKRKKKKERRLKKGKSFVDNVQPLPPKLTEMRVWPLAMSIEVSWKPPNHGTVRGYQVGYGISIPDVYKIDVNASLLHYVIQHLEPEQEYIVSVRARNKAGLGSPLYETVRTGRSKGSSSSSSLLLAPVEVQATTVSESAVKVSWADSSVLKLRGGVEGDTGKLYTVRHLQLNHVSTKDKPKFVFTNSTESSLLIQGLRPYTRYEFAVRVSQDLMRSVWSMTVTNTTFASTPSTTLAEVTTESQLPESTPVTPAWSALPAASRPPTAHVTAPASLSVTVAEGDPTMARLTWNPSFISSGTITGYLVFSSTQSKLPIDDWIVEAVNGEQTSVTVSDLLPNTKYFFRLQAQNAKGDGMLTSVVSYKTPKVHGEMAENVTVRTSSDDPHSALVSWQPPSNARRTIHHYVVVSQDLAANEARRVSVPGDVFTLVMAELQPARSYQFTVQPRYRHGSGPRSLPVLYLVPQDLTGSGQQNTG